MKLHAIISSVALVTALSFSGAAVAQNMFRGEEIPAEYTDMFKDRCAALSAAGTASLTTNDDQYEATDQTQTGSVASDSSTTSDDLSDPAAQDNWLRAMASVTVEECAAAGF